MSAEPRITLKHNPAFTGQARVALVQDVRDKRFFGVAMKGGKYVVRLPFGYDGKTSVRWINGFIIVAHPLLPPLLADTTTGKVEPFNLAMWEQLLRDVKTELKVSANARVIH